MEWNSLLNGRTPKIVFWLVLISVSVGLCQLLPAEAFVSPLETCNWTMGVVLWTSALENSELSPYKIHFLVWNAALKCRAQLIRPEVLFWLNTWLVIEHLSTHCTIYLHNLVHRSHYTCGYGEVLKFLWTILVLFTASPVQFFFFLLISNLCFVFFRKNIRIP